MPLSSKKRPVRHALALAAALLALQAQAAPVALTAGAGAEAPQGTPGTVNVWANSPTYQSVYANASDPLGSAYGGGFSNSYGAFAVSANTQGNGLALGRSGLDYVITNTSTIDQLVTMSFWIYGGSMSATLDYGFTGTLDAGEYLETSYLARILRNGSQVWSSGATLRQDAGGISFSSSGTTLAGADTNTSDGNYFWAGSYYQVELGLLAAGASFAVSTELGADASSNVGSYIYDGGGGGYCGYDYGGYGYGDCGCGNPETVQTFTLGNEQNPCEQTRFKGGTSVFYGDPVNFSLIGGGPMGSDDEGSTGDSVAASFRLRNPNAVPLPSTVWLAGLAVAGLLAQSARRRRH